MTDRQQSPVSGNGFHGKQRHTKHARKQECDEPKQDRRLMRLVTNVLIGTVSVFISGVIASVLFASAGQERLASIGLYAFIIFAVVFAMAYAVFWLLRRRIIQRQ